DLLPAVPPVRRVRAGVPGKPAPVWRRDHFGGAEPDELGARSDGGGYRDRVSDALVAARRVGHLVRVQPWAARGVALLSHRPARDVRVARAERDDPPGAPHQL